MCGDGIPGASPVSGFWGVLINLFLFVVALFYDWLTLS